MKLLLLFTLLVAALLYAGTRQSEDPILIISEGKAAATANCSKATGKNQITCYGYECEISLHERNILPPYASFQQWHRTHQIEGQPGKSIHMGKYTHDGKIRFVKCEMNNAAVTSAYEISERDFSSY